MLALESLSMGKKIPLGVAGKQEVRELQCSEDGGVG